MPRDRYADSELIGGASGDLPLPAGSPRDSAVALMSGFALAPPSIAVWATAPCHGAVTGSLGGDRESIVIPTGNTIASTCATMARMSLTRVRSRRRDSPVRLASVPGSPRRSTAVRLPERHRGVPPAARLSPSATITEGPHDTFTPAASVDACRVARSTRETTWAASR